MAHYFLVYNSVPEWLNILILLCILMSQNGSLFFSMIAYQNGSLCQDGSIHLCMPQLLATSLHSQNGSILLCKTACKNVIVALHAYLPSMPQFCAYLSVPGLLTSLYTRIVSNTSSHKWLCADNGSLERSKSH